MLYYALVRPKSVYTSPVWNNIMTTDANKLQNIQRKFAAPCFSRFFILVPYTSIHGLQFLKLYTSQLEGTSRNYMISKDQNCVPS